MLTKADSFLVYALVYCTAAATAFTLRMKGTVFIATTLDGKIAESDGGVRFLEEYNQAECGDMGFTEFLSSVDVIVMGRRSFDMVVSFGEDMWAYGETPVVVWTQSGDVSIPEFLSGKVTSSSLPPKKLMDDLKSRGKSHAYIDGGKTVQSFLREGLIQTMIITRVPLVLGQGIDLFGNDCASTWFQHVGTKTFPNGLVQSTYAVDDSKTLT